MPSNPAADTQLTYLDYAATAPFDPRLAEALAGASWANANSLHAAGREARKQFDAARRSLAQQLGARQPAEIIFTSGGTESDNMAIKGLLPVNGNAANTHIVVSTIEHHAVLDAAASLKRFGYKVDTLGCGRDGVCAPEALEELLARTEAAGHVTALVCVMAVNNELGTVQPVRELARVAHAHKAKFFTDCVQAVGKIAINLEESGVDAAAFSGHKVGAPKGIGALYLRRGNRIAPLVHGGGQENGLRSGTSNVPGAVAFAQAVEFAMAEREQTCADMAAIRNRILEGIATLDAAHAIKPTLISDDACVPHILSLLCRGLEGETVVQRLDMAGVCVSSGSACSTGSLDPSHVMLAIGVPKQDAFGSLRLSFGPGSTLADADAFLTALPHALR